MKKKAILTAALCLVLCAGVLAAVLLGPGPAQGGNLAPQGPAPVADVLPPAASGAGSAAAPAEEEESVDSGMGSETPSAQSQAKPAAPGSKPGSVAASAVSQPAAPAAPPPADTPGATPAPPASSPANTGRWEGGKYLLPDGSYATGITVIGGAIYGFDSNGNMLLGRHKLNGGWYHFDENSGMAQKGWLADPENTEAFYYYGEQGAALTGLHLLADGNRYYFDASTGARQRGLKQVEGRIYYFAGKNDSAVTGWNTISAAEAAAAGLTPDNGSAQPQPAPRAQMLPEAFAMASAGAEASAPDAVAGAQAEASAPTENQGENRYHFSAETHYAATGVQPIDGKVYGFTSKGVQLGGWQFMGAKLYSFTGSGGSALTAAWASHPQGRVYLGADGAALSGLQEIGGELYWLGFVAAGGWINVDGEVYCFEGTNNAALKSQWRLRPGHSYQSYLGADGKAYRGARKVGETLYGFADDGEGLRGMNSLEGKIYFFNEADGAAQTGWLPAGQRDYYVGPEGYAYTGVQTIEGKIYYFEPATAQKGTGWVKYNGKKYLFDGADSEARTGEYETGASHYYFGADGAAYTGLRSIGDGLYYYDAEGLRKSGWQEIAGARYYFAQEGGKARIGWFTDVTSGGVYYFGTDGKAYTGNQTINGIGYAFAADGKLKPGSEDGKWLVDGGNTYYLRADGSPVIGLADIAGAKYYFNENGVRQSGKITLSGRQYFFDPQNECKAAAGWQPTAEGKYYYGPEGYAYTGVCEVDGALYGFAEDGLMLTGAVAQNGARYWFGADGKALSGWQPGSDALARYYAPGAFTALTGMQAVDGKLYWFDDAGLRQSGWRRGENGLLYYFKTTDDLSAVTGAYHDENGQYYFTPEGYAMVGLVRHEEGGPWYYHNAEGLRQSGWQRIAGKRYYFGDDGAAYTGLRTVDGDSYYFNEEFAFALTGLCEIDGVTYVFDEDGKLIASDAPAGYAWKTIGGVPHYVDADGQPPEAGLNKIDGYWYWLSEAGAAETGWKGLDVPGEDGETLSRSYYFGQDGRAVIGWHVQDGDTYCFGAEGYALTGIQSLGGMEYEFGDDGKLITGEAPAHSRWETDENGEETMYRGPDGALALGLTRIGEDWYFFGQDNKMTTGWQSTRDARYYFGEDGTALKNGWHQVPEALPAGETVPRWYHFAGDARQLTGWQYRSENEANYTYYYFADGALPYGWSEVNGARRYFYPEGHMATGWAEIDGQRSYFFTNGERAVGVCTIEGKLYSFDNDGRMQTGWNVDAEGHRYYFGPEGAASGWQKIEERWYRFDTASFRQLTGWQYRSEGDERYTFFYNADGSLPTAGDALLGGVPRYFFPDGHMAVGFEMIDGWLCYFATSGERVTGTAIIGGVSYAFGPEGRLTPGWNTGSLGRYYYGEHGALKGWETIGGVWHRFHDETAVQLTGWQTRTDGGETTSHYFSAAGEPSVGWTGSGAARRYFHADGSAAEGWEDVDGLRYYFRSGGLRATGVVDIDGTPHSFDEDGQLLLGWNTSEDGSRYYFGEGGAVFKGWQSAEGRLYHFDEATGAQQLGWQQRAADGKTLYYYYFANGTLPQAGWNTAIDGASRYVMEDGQLGQGFMAIDGKLMCLTEKGEALSGWQQIDGRWYLFSAEGVQQTGWQTRITETGYAALYYYFEDGSLPPAGWTNTVEDTRRYIMADGETARGWLTLDGFKYYFEEGGVPLVGRHSVEGVSYFFDAEGRMVAPPSITKVAVDSGSAVTKNVTVTAAVSPLLPDKAILYSFDAGKTWQSANKAAYNVSSGAVTIPKNSIQVKDSAGSVFVYDKAVTVPMGRSHGVDVALYQGQVDWAKVKQSGQVQFAIIRSLRWDSAKGGYAIDPYFEQNVRGAKANGIKVGTYLYSYAFNDKEMEEEVRYFMNSPEIQRMLNSGSYFDLPVFIDYEDPLISKNTANQTIDQRTRTVRYGMVLIEQLSGYRFRPGFYVNYSWAINMINAAQLQSEGFDFWLARWSSAHGWTNPGAPALWQYSNGEGHANIPGINARVDRNWQYKNYAGDIDGGKIPTPDPGGPVAGGMLTVTNQGTGKAVTGSAAGILAQIVMAEVGGFNNAEVYKAQAIAAHAWILNQYSQGVAAPRVALKAPTGAVTSAVNAVAGKTLTYNGQPALTPYYAYSNGKTNDARYWNPANNIPYLVTVDSSYDTRFEARTKTISEGDLKNKLKSIYGYDVTVGYAPQDWVKITGTNSGGYVTALNVCGRTPKPDYFITNIVSGIGSPSFTVSYSGGTFTFTYRGLGHGIGMSQQGANGMAQQGKNYKQILAHYYPGTQIVDL